MCLNFGQTTPKIALADKNINGRLAGVLDGQGKPINKAKEAVEILRQAQKN